MATTAKTVERAERPDPARFSYYVDDDYYTWLASIAAGWAEPGTPAVAEVATACERLVVREARLIDDKRFDDWLGLFTAECLYWIPSTPDGGNPRREVSYEFHDRRRLEDRIARLRTGKAYSQIPATRTRHFLTNFETWSPKEGEARVRANFSIRAFQSGIHRELSGWCGWVLRTEDGVWKIVVKQINLIDSDCGQENNTFVL